MSPHETDSPYSRGRRGTTPSPPAPLLPAAVGLAGGVAVDSALAPRPWVYIAGGAIVLVALVMPAGRQRHAWVIAVLAAACLGGLRHDAFFRREAPDHIARYAIAQLAVVRLNGVVVTTPGVTRPRTHFFRRWTYQPRRTQFLLEAESMETGTGVRPVSGLVAVRVDEDLPDVRAGDRVSAFGVMSRPGGPANPGQFDHALWQRRQGVLVTMRCRGTDLVKVTTPAAHPWRVVLAGFQRTAGHMMLEDELAFGGEERSLIETLVLGRRYAINAETEDRFMRTGTTHYLSVSGAHVGVVAGFIWFVTRWLGGTRRGSAAIVLPAIVLFAALVDPQPPVFRAAIIGGVYCVGVMLGRTAHGVNSTALAAIVLLGIRPTMLFEPGFQMSFAGVLGILYLHEPLLGLWRRLVEGRRPEDEQLMVDPPVVSIGQRVGRRFYHATCALAAVGVAAWLATAPIAWFHFGRTAPLGWFNSLILFPFFSATLLGGVAVAVAGLVFPVTLMVLRPLVNAVAAALLGVVRVLDDVTYEARGVGAVVVQIACLALIGLAVRASYMRSGLMWFDLRGVLGRWFWTDHGARRRKRVAALSIAIVASAALLLGFTLNGRNDELRITWLAVGDGHASVIEFPDGRTWLYDCGSNVSYDVGRNTIVPFCRHRGFGRLDRVLLSHPNLDHFSGLISVLDDLDCGPVVVNRYFDVVSPPDGPASAMLVELKRRGHPVQVVDRSLEGPTPGEVDVELLWPPEHLPVDIEANETSTVMRLTYHGRSVLLCGDIEAVAIDTLLKRGHLCADVLVLPHHGGVAGNTADFIAAVNPRVCIRSSNRRADRTPAQLTEAVGSRAHFNTADDGAVTLVIDENSLSVSGYLRDPQGNYRIPHEAAKSSLTIDG